MRRVSGFVLTLLGAFFLLAALLLRFWIAPSAVKFPLDEYQVVTLTGTGSYYSPVQGKELNGVSVQITYTTRGDVPAGSGSVAVWDQFVSVRDMTNREPISYVTIREAFGAQTLGFQLDVGLDFGIEIACVALALEHRLTPPQPPSPESVRWRLPADSIWWFL